MPTSNIDPYPYTYTYTSTSNSIGTSTSIPYYFNNGAYSIYNKKL